MGKTLLESAKFHKGLEMSETPFGELKLHPSALAFDIKGKAVFFEIMTESFDEKDVTDEVFGGEMNLHRIYPNRKAFDFDENRRVLLSK
ncbi:MAG: hypothetical protein GY705_28105 [Bacteroidetes bacterium]|nr:hypothetical protein [Bacteroidota bacterium]